MLFLIKSRVGFLSNYILKKERFVRSKNPIFSYVSVGKNRNLLNKLGKSAFGKNSLYEKIYNEKFPDSNFFKSNFKFITTHYPHNTEIPDAVINMINNAK